ncbi:MAG: hypothetical protein QOG22_1445, partial [Pseudonocardiales bacterium]|nr:hypothetical protein [Pseudonocardiales bacterium]
DLLGGVSKLLGPLTKEIATNCTAILKQAGNKAPPKTPNLNDLKVILGGQPIIPGAGG